MKKRLKRLVTSVCALFVMLLALTGTSVEAGVPSSWGSCTNAGGCAESCGGDECGAIGKCDTYCEADACDDGSYWVGCVPEVY